MIRRLTASASRLARNAGVVLVDRVDLVDEHLDRRPLAGPERRLRIVRRDDHDRSTVAGSQAGLGSGAVVDDVDDVERRLRPAPGTARRRPAAGSCPGTTITVSSGRRTPLNPTPKMAMIRNGPRTRLTSAPGPPDGLDQLLADEGQEPPEDGRAGRAPSGRPLGVRRRRAVRRVPLDEQREDLVERRPCPRRAVTTSPPVRGDRVDQVGQASPSVGDGRRGSRSGRAARGGGRRARPRRTAASIGSRVSITTTSPPIASRRSSSGVPVATTRPSAMSSDRVAVPRPR